MKALILAVAAPLISLVAAAQLTEGKVIYERKQNMHKNLPPEAEQFKAMVPEFNTVKMELAFKGQQSLYKPYVSDDDDLPSTDQGGGGGGMRMMRFGGGAPQGESFKDFEKDTKTEIRELGPKKYLLDDSLRHFTWKLTKDTITIAGHLCHKATTAMKGAVMNMRFGRNNGGGGNSDTAKKEAPLQQVTAWYADDIASPAGPDDFGGLPGLILAVDVEDGLITYIPLSIDPKAGTVKAPSNGKKISREDYRTLSEQQMGNRRPGGNNVIIRGN